VRPKSSAGGRFDWRVDGPVTGVREPGASLKSDCCATSPIWLPILLADNRLKTLVLYQDGDIGPPNETHVGSSDATPKTLDRSAETEVCWVALYL
jgi:hypothetical protein